jgi:hypothetical protein
MSTEQLSVSSLAGTDASDSAPPGLGDIEAAAIALSDISSSVDTLATVSTVHSDFTISQ